MQVEANVEKRHRLVREIVEVSVLTVLIFMVLNFAVQNFDVDGRSMEPTLHNHERLMVDKWTYRFQEPARGDIIVFKAPLDPTSDYVKRIIGIPGDVISIHDTTVIVNGVTLQETYVDPRYQGNPFVYKVIEKVVVPPGHYFVLGDDRKNSSDSREWGFVPRENIAGRGFLLFWPPGEDNTGFLKNVSSVFAHVPSSSHRA